MNILAIISGKALIYVIRAILLASAVIASVVLLPFLILELFNKDK